MTRHVDTTSLRRLATVRGLPTLLTEMADAIREDFLRWEDFDKSPRVAGPTVVPAASVAEAVRGADIVTTVTADKTRATILTAAMVEPGMHINAVGGDCPGTTELDPRILERGPGGGRIRAPEAHRGGDPADVHGLPRDRALTGARRPRPGPAGGLRRRS